ncbi:MAG: CoA transferase [Acidimicrobiales bacterium]
MAIAGAWTLTGRFDGPPIVPPADVVRRIAALGEPISVDPVPLLAERALDAGFTRSGVTTCGGAGRLLRAADGWVAVNLPRDDDVASVPAWLEVDDGGEPWPTIEATVPARTTSELVDRAILLGLPVSALGEVPPPPAPVAATRVGDAPPSTGAPLVADLSSLWAGPLCTRLLADRGGDVVKVESPTRPDGARGGPRPFFERLHAGKRSLVCDLSSPELADLLRRADVVVEASRPRALRQLGIVAEEVRPRVWLSITGYGRATDRVAFGDDAGVAGGLVARDDRGPVFLADAVADPLTGVAAAAAVIDALEQGGRWVLDAALAGVAAHVAGE